MPSTSPSTLRVGRRAVSLSSPAKPMYALPRGKSFTKADVADYALRIAPVMLPHLKGRPLSLKRFPDGAGGKSFFEKNCPEHRPAWVRTFPLHPGAGEPGPNLCLATEPASLAWLANLAALEIHTYLWTTKRPRVPSWLVLDLDPGPGASITDCCRVGLRLRELLLAVSLRSWAKTSGGKGLHLLVPLNTPSASFAGTRALAQALAVTLERDDPARITAGMAKAHRPGRVFIDWSQNARHKTTVAAYSLRAGPGPTVSTPVAWEEVEAAAKPRRAAALRFTAPETHARVETDGDLLAGVLTTRQTLPAGADW